jgi:SpoVK/Ycf46/Vps4 family AAA+-type ATPase
VIDSALVEGLPFRLTPEQAARARTAAQLQADVAGEDVDLGHLAAGARAQNAGGLERLALRVAPDAGWDDLVLPDDVTDQLVEIEHRVRHRDTVLDEWGIRLGGAKGKGVTALFAGDSGTGKTLAAEVLAGALDLDLYVIDLATVVDKYIGETEKNLDRIFREADRVNGVLLFDEADAIFGKRSEVNDARDRYANVEVAYLLQRMERFDGIAILTTNLRANIDEAFLRRLDALVEFPLPDEELRHAIWARHLPPSLPRDEDVDLDFLAASFELSGGNIKNIAVTAAFLAAADDGPLTMSALIRATAREYRKLGRLVLPSEFGPHFDLL